MADKVKRAFRYAGVKYAVGDSFEAQSEKDRKLLLTIGNIETEQKSEVRQKRRKYRTKVQEPKAAETPVDSGEQTVIETHDRFYHRRDLEAE